jgi:transcription initiation factor TFIIIB Brf1 subunit/transcription initiation factor TFIIB
MAEESWIVFDLLKEAERPEPCDHLSEYLCRHCGGVKVFNGVDIDLPTCMECGIQDDCYISDEPEWRSGGNPDEGGGDPSRCGAPVNTDLFSAQWGMNTIMTGRSKLQTINMHASMNHKDRALFHAYAQMDKIGKETLNLQDNVMYSAKMKYKAFNEAILTRGAVRNGIKANCVFQACREYNVARTTKEIADAFNIPSRDISRTFDMYQEQNPETGVHVTQPADLVPRFMNSLSGIQDEERRRLKMKIIKVCKSLEECVELMGRTPKAICCAVIFIVMTELNFKPIKKDICRICEVSEPTLSKIETIIKKEFA